MNLLTSSARRHPLIMRRIPPLLRRVAVAPAVFGLFTLCNNAFGQEPAASSAAAPTKAAPTKAASKRRLPAAAKPAPTPPVAAEPTPPAAATAKAAAPVAAATTKAADASPESAPVTPTPAVAPAPALAAGAPETSPAPAPTATATPTDTPAPAGASAPAATAATTAAATTAAVATVAVKPEPAKPEAPPEPEQPLYAFLDVGLVVHTLWNTTPAYDFFDDDNHLTQGGISLGVDAVELSPATVLNVDVSAITGETESTGPLPDFVSRSTLKRTDVGAGVSLRHHIWSWLAPYARVSGAAAFEEARIDVLNAADIEQDTTKFAGTIGGGLSLFSPPKRVSASRRYVNSIALRVNVEAGYQLTAAIPFEMAAEPAAEDSRNIAQAATPFGELKQNGAFLRVTVGAHF